ncbi:MAG: squalene synthase HpnC [Phycisphaeraceae bacterium]|nr:squalene synthase HpnC [Phycisphaeraceae bacterium]
MSSTILSQLPTYGPEHCPKLTYEQACAYTRALTASHYENFTVVSWLLPKRLRDDFRNVYSFCRWADDLGDETGDPQKSLELLNWWRREIDLCYADQPRHPVFVALRETIRRHDIPRKPFDDLVDAFIQDQTVTRYDTFAQVLDYCTRSANPVGRLVLYLCGHRDPQRQELSDATCTALQLANFWQDVRRDILERDRVYIPADVAHRHGLDIRLMVTAVASSAKNPTASACGCDHCGPSTAALRALLPTYAATLKDLVDRTKPLFAQGRGLWPLVPRDVRLDIKLFSLGGQSILRMIERLDYNTLTTRPSLSKPAKISLMLRAVLGKITTFAAPAPSATDHSPRPLSTSPPGEADTAVSPATLEGSFAFCRQLTRRCARNFYYGMRLTPEPKRSAMFAIYAWMRAADDLADQQAEPAVKEKQLLTFRRQTQRAMDPQGGLSADPLPTHVQMWPAVRETFLRYRLPDAYFQAMIDGQILDQNQTRYATFAELDRYCYLVAGTVGLICVHIWGYGGGQETLELAKQRGLAFQLTNILRDLREDALRDRVYLPQDELARFGFTAESFRQAVIARQPTPAFDELLALQIERARACYDRSNPLDGLLPADSRSTSWALMKIYRGLLDKIAADPRAMLFKRIRLSSVRKASIALAALLQSHASSADSPAAKPGATQQPTHS